MAFDMLGVFYVSFIHSPFQSVDDAFDPDNLPLSVPIALKIIVLYKISDFRISFLFFCLCELAVNIF